MKALVFITDGYGNRGGIARFNQQMLEVLTQLPSIVNLTVLPRSKAMATEVAVGIDYRFAAGRGALAFLWESLHALLRVRSLRLVICGHIHLLPISVVVALVRRVPLLLIVHGLEGWSPPSRRIVPRLIGQVDRVLCVSNVTRDRFLGWSGLSSDKVVVIPNAIDLDAYGPGDKPDYLLKRYGIEGGKVILTMGRMDSEERAKGFDQVIGVMPSLLAEDSRIYYVLVGDGTDRSRLEARARDMGLESRILFTGWICDDEKVDHFRLADAYVMPSRMEGFGYVFIEALACGIPVVGSRIDGGADALDGGLLGELVDPDAVDELILAIRSALARPKQVPDGISKYSLDDYGKSFRGLVTDLLASYSTKRCR